MGLIKKMKLIKEKKFDYGEIYTLKLINSLKSDEKLLFCFFF